MFKKIHLPAILLSATMALPAVTFAKDDAFFKVSTHHEKIKLNESKVDSSERGYSIALGSINRKARTSLAVSYIKLDDLKHTSLNYNNDLLYPLNRKNALYFGGSVAYDELKPAKKEVTSGFSAGARAGLIHRISRKISIDIGYYYSITTTKLDDLRVKNIERYHAGLAYRF